MTTPPLPGPAQARNEQRAAAGPAISRLREVTRAAIAHGDGRYEIYAAVPPGTGTVAFNAVRAELEALGWHVRRESSPKNESFMVLGFPDDGDAA